MMDFVKQEISNEKTLFWEGKGEHKIVYRAVAGGSAELCKEVFYFFVLLL